MAGIGGADFCDAASDAASNAYDADASNTPSDGSDATTGTDGSDASSVTELPHDAEWDAGTPPRHVPALLVPLFYLQAATLPPVDWTEVYTVGANFSLVPGSWQKSHARIDRSCTASGRPIPAGGSVGDGPREFARIRYPIATLLTVDNPLVTDAVVFQILQKAPASDSEANEDDVVQVLAGKRSVRWYDAWSAWFHSSHIVRHTPDAPEEVLRDMKPTKVAIEHFE